MDILIDVKIVEIQQIRNIGKKILIKFRNIMKSEEIKEKNIIVFLKIKKSLGYFEDDATILSKAIEYLKNKDNV